MRPWIEDPFELVQSVALWACIAGVAWWLLGPWGPLAVVVVFSVLVFD
jgi:hypothetical protein